MSFVRRCSVEDWWRCRNDLRRCFANYSVTRIHVLRKPRSTAVLFMNMLNGVKTRISDWPLRLAFFPIFSWCKFEIAPSILLDGGHVQTYTFFFWLWKSVGWMKVVEAFYDYVFLGEVGYSLKKKSQFSKIPDVKLLIFWTRRIDEVLGDFLLTYVYFLRLI